MNKMKIVLTTGGTAGHIYPALSVAREFERQGHDVHLIGYTKHLHLEKICQKNFPWTEIISESPRGSLKNILKGWVSQGKAYAQAKNVLSKIQPDAVIGFGGYASFAVMLAAKRLGIWTAIHEQNVLPGRVNKFLSKIVHQTFLTFEQTENYLNRKKTFVTGYPCWWGEKEVRILSRSEIMQKYQLDSDRRTVLVFGGSQGSQAINDVVSDVFCSKLKQNDDLQLIHLTGVDQTTDLTQMYRGCLKIPFANMGFCSRMYELYSVADVVVSRAGAGTIAEVKQFGCPAILIPYPHAGEHQKYNAQAVSDQMKIIEEKDLSHEVLGNDLMDCLADLKQKTDVDLSSDAAAKKIVQCVIDEIQQ